MAGLWPVSPVQWPAVSTTVGEISVPEHRKRPDSVVNRMTPTLVCAVSRWLGRTPVAGARSACVRPSRRVIGSPLGKLPTPLLRTGRFTGLEVAPLGDQEALRLGDHLESVLAQEAADALGGTSGQHSRHVDAGVEGRCLR